MRTPRLRFTIGSLMIAVALVALAIAAHDRYFRDGVAIVYRVGDLLDPSAPKPIRDEQLARLASRMKGSVTPDAWWSPRRTVTPFSLGDMLIVRHTPAAHRQVVETLRRWRAGHGG